MNNIVMGILAHVDAGKTTLSEAFMYLTGNIRKMGRVDHGDAFLDTFELEKQRGITIFSKQAIFELPDYCVSLLDTPGHVDFSAEMERTLQVLDYAVLLISGADGVQGHTRTLWKLLSKYEVPTFIFVNKMDQSGTDREALMKEISAGLDSNCIPFDQGLTEEIFENIATCDEAVLEEFLENGEIETKTIQTLIKTRKLFPCYFGSALKMEGIKELMTGLNQYLSTDYEEDGFGARVYKISRDDKGNRLTHLKITSGRMKVKDLIEEEKVNQIRLYSGGKYETTDEVLPGQVCAVTGLDHTYAGMGLGREEGFSKPILEPVLNYRVLLPEGMDEHQMLSKLRLLEEEDPSLKINWEEELGEIQLKLMGEVQLEILKSLIKDRFGVEISFDKGNIVYKETISTTVEGVGHYEPLRHYAEVHLILEPGERGSGLQFETSCSEDELDKNWQRLIFTHLTEKIHRGVKVNGELTDVKITLAAGRAHLKHTEGGDFRQSTYRAIRQGLMKAESVILEPIYEFILDLPSECVGRAMTDIKRMHGEFETPDMKEDRAIIKGTAPVATMRDYQTEVLAYSRGQGHLSCLFKGYDECHNPEEVIAEAGYDPEADMSQPTGSIFCLHGAGFYVSWDQVDEYMHIESKLKKPESKEKQDLMEASNYAKAHTGVDSVHATRKRDKVYERLSLSSKEEEELEEIFIRTYGKYEKKAPVTKRVSSAPTAVKKPKVKQKEYLLVDGYNVIHAWDELKELANVDMGAARGKLLDILCNYQGFKKCILIAVFDAYQLEGEPIKTYKYHNIYVVFTKEAETADMYIEKVVHETARKDRVTVVTSDSVEQVVIQGQGAHLISSREFEMEYEEVRKQIREEKDKFVEKQSDKNYLFEAMGKDFAEEMEQIRLGKKRPN